MRFFKKIQDWILKSEIIRNGFCFSLLNRSIQDLSDRSASKELRRLIHFQSGIFGSFDAPWSERSWIDLFRKEKKIRFRWIFFKTHILNLKHFSISRGRYSELFFKEVLILLKMLRIMMCSPSSPSPPLSSQQLLPTSQPNEGARLARRQKIKPREECCMQKTSPSAARSVSVSVRCKNLGFSQLQGRNYWSHCSF